ncbi:hypothetical protein [Porphyrobacter sp. YT40]|uniref:hypothetical protein n=1 Tax=Porphyrobacter sp. YT40 TaxID=2547601 RepID=UPI001143BAC8|nr:hypothetical protein [Porphyrobacter sp. YT40]QDH35270.1 hypothetical protein E2E27_13650 [Porphyrobacter sp. YT40]
MKDVAFRLLIVLGWTAALPPLGYSIFGVLTIWPMLGVFLGFGLLPFIYAAGAAPAFVTAASFEFVFRHWGSRLSLAASVTLGATAAVLWMAGLFFFEGEKVRVGANYVTFALAIAGALPAALMPIARFARDRRSWR